MNEDSLTYTIDESLSGLRLDKALAQLNESISRTHIQKLIEQGDLLVNDAVVKASYKVKLHDVITLLQDDVEELDVEAENIPLDIIYEDNDVVVVNKPVGMITHPATGINHGTLVNALLYHCTDLSGINGVARPGIVHRIDKDTSGLIVVAKNDLAHIHLSEQLKTKTCRRTYLCLVNGVIPHETGTIDAPVGRHPVHRKEMAVVADGKRAVTHFKVIERFKHYTLLQCDLETGRTHQIRVHLSYIGYPIEGDLVYGSNNRHLYDQGQLLHAFKLGFVHPRSNEYVEFTAPLPKHFSDVLEKVRNENES